MNRVEEVQVQVSNETPMYGDVLETILSYMPLIDLVPASCVSKTWSHAVVFSLQNINKPKPWLIVYCQSTRAPYSVSTYGYDPSSHVWIEISYSHVQSTSPLRLSDSNLLYMLSPSKFSFSNDPLHLKWRHVDGPRVWRADPIVSMVNEKVIIAGGVCEFEDDPLAVEMYDIESNTWSRSKSMPFFLKESASSMWLSTAVAKNKLFVMEKSSGVTHWFDPRTEVWSDSFYLLPDQRIFHYAFGFSTSRWILIGLIGSVENLEAVKIYKVEFDEDLSCEEMGEIPLEFIEKLKSESFGISSLNICMAGDLVYLYNAAAMEEVVVGEVVVDGGGGWRWWNVKNEAVSDRRMVCACVEVGVDELRRVMSGVNRRIS